MLDTFFIRAQDELITVIRNAVDECLRQKGAQVGTEHLLLGLTRESDNLAARALASMKIDANCAQHEVDQYHHGKELPDFEHSLAARYSKPLLRRVCIRKEECTPALSEMSIQALLRAEDYSRYFGQSEISPAHLLLGILDLPDAGAIKVFEELSADLTFLRRQVMRMMAREMCLSASVVGVHAAVIKGLKELVDKHEFSLNLITALALKSQSFTTRLPGRGEVLHMICTAFLGDFLSTQVTLQRYLLEETVDLLKQRSGPLDKEISAAILSSSAQNFRAEVRSIIEHLWSHEYRLISQMFDDAEHDLIGSVIEDLWWCQSEEIALDESFAAALEDHRRAQLLSLQKRRIEISQRLTKLKDRLDDTIRQCFVKRSVTNF
jgi:ATP-dependent Clp protease ATP-binding subunit ClpA